MRILILTFGTRGDVQPYVALAHTAIAAGHEVAVCTAEGFRPLVEDAGVPYLHMSNDMLDLIQSEMPTMSGAADSVRLIRRMTAAMRASLHDQWGASQTFEPDMLVYHPKCLAGLHIAERLRIPAAVSLPLPFFTPTRAFPVPFIAHWPLGRSANRLSYQINRFTALAYGGMINTFRQSTLGLAPLSRWSDYLPSADGRPVPTLYGFSSAVVPVPADYPPYAHITGYWFLPDQAAWEPPPDLQSFLAAGEPPLYIGFGSMGFGKNAAARGATILEAVRSVGVRAVVATGWGGIDATTMSSDKVLVVRDVPHEWLFPRTVALVHHGGAGTTAAGLRAGRPTLVCPVLGDQGFWAERVSILGAGPRPIPIRRLTPTNLTERLNQLLTEQRYRSTADNLGEAIRSEDGTGHALRTLERINKMRM
ncbi:MAG TPA: glycosyltransferase [Mycobacterium sp.]